MAILWEMSSLKASWYQTVPESITILLFVYPMSSLIFFGLLCTVISDQLFTIGELIQNIPPNGISQLKDLQKEHARISASINLINLSFGPILLVEIFYLFIGVIVGSVHWMVAIISNRGWSIYFLSFCIMSLHIVHLTLISFSAEKIKYQVKHIPIQIDLMLT